CPRHHFSGFPWARVGLSSLPHSTSFSLSGLHSFLSFIGFLVSGYQSDSLLPIYAIYITTHARTHVARLPISIFHLAPPSSYCITTRTPSHRPPSTPHLSFRPYPQIIHPPSSPPSIHSPTTISHSLSLVFGFSSISTLLPGFGVTSTSTGTIYSTHCYILLRTYTRTHARTHNEWHLVVFV
ncbi:hypothetical protein C8R44DRAFT_990895, partial [Mycena epipterygia]